jgi:5-methylcytosine-specific restriction endonuclease McrA
MGEGILAIVAILRKSVLIFPTVLHMKIILSQRIDIESEYEDIPFSTYHFPKRYRNQIHPGDRFIYYQGDRSNREHRYYFGCGVIGVIEASTTGESYFAEILEGRRFSTNVPIYLPDGKGFVESIGHDQVRNRPNPSWQNSIRKISDKAFSKILELANVDVDAGKIVSQVESESNALEVLSLLNTRYANVSPKDRAKKIQNHLDRGSAVTKALKSLLGAKCQICGWKGFEKKNGEGFIEAHHIVQLSEKKEGSLCTENIVLLCPNCHREVHYGKDFSVSDDLDNITIKFSANKVTIKKNTMEYLSQLNELAQ